MLISCNLYGGNFEIFSTYSQTRLTQDPMATCVQKWYFQKFGTYTRNGNFGGFFLVRT